MTMTSVFAQQMWNGLVSGMAYVLFAMGLNLIFGTLGVINMAHGELYMLGAMMLWTLTTLLHLNFFLSFILSVAIVGIFGMIFNRFVVKPLIVMYGGGLVWDVDARPIETPIGGSTALFGAVLTNESIVLCCMGVVTLIGLNYFLGNTTLGKAIRAAAEDKVGAGLVGININLIYSVTMGIAALLAAIAGGIIGPIWVADPSMGQEILLKGFAIVVVGGLGNLKNCVMVGLFLGITEALFSQYISMYYRDVYAFGIMVLVCLWRPEGLFKRK
jgi:branched-chain amino acid transport system permease protein